MKYRFCVIPCSMSPLIRDMHRRTIYIEADSLRSAKAIVAQAFPDGLDLAGEWSVEPETLKAKP